MALDLTFAGNTGVNYVATLERLSDNLFWNDVAAAWQASPSFANKKIALTEGTGENVESFTASVASLGSAGIVRVRFHDDDDANDKVVDVAHVEVQSDDAIGFADVINTNVDAALSGSVNDASPAAGDFDGDAGLSAVDDFYIGSYLAFTSGNLQGMWRRVTDYNGTSKNLSFAEPFPAAPADTDTFVIGGFGGI
jgi:hypothetical protein